jgi:putative iron-only hydrogenase system regulator
MSDEQQERRLAVLSIVVEDRSMSEKLNAYLSEYGDCVVGRMGIPYREKGVSVLCVVLDAPMPTLNALTGKIGMLKGVSAKMLFSKY